MKIKKKELRRREAQLPINYPHPEVADASVRVEAATFNAEETRVEALCRRLAHNEVAVRDAVLAELPRYIQSVTQRLVGLEACVDVAALRRCIVMQSGGKSGKDAGGEKRVVINVLRELEAYRNREENVRREQRRQAALRRLQQERQQAVRGGDNNNNNNNNNDDKNCMAAEKEEEELNMRDAERKSLRRIYGEWISVWCEMELVLLKLSRGLFFCLWHSDKPLVQLECAQRIARLIHAPHTNSGKILLFSCLMRVLMREWRSMDRHRADKFLALVRKMIYELACLLGSLEVETRQQQQQQQKQGGGDNEAGTNGGVDRSAPAGGTVTSRGASSRAGRKRERNEDEGGPFHGDADVLTHDPLCRALDEACYVFQWQIVPEPTAVGLSMHVCDVLFDELCRAALSPTLFVALSDRIAFHAMSRGNYVEKRVLDYFISPMAGGMLSGRRRQQHQQKNGQSTSVGASNKRKRCRNEDKTSSGSSHDESAGHAAADAETRAILLQLADCCKKYSVARRTVHSVRVMFTEGEMALRQAANPEEYEELTRGDLRRRIEQEVAEVGKTRHAVVEERRNLRRLRQQEKKQQQLQRLKRKKKENTENIFAASTDNDDDWDGNDDNEAVQQKLEKMRKKTRRPQPRDTKRKKHYTLTKEDLYGDE
ncbi:hypothetical protein MOQ_010275 [Trypanosoma cruzi marinkellei]|uniref:Uncharacterized protein n=1 Tax=Trypanosoma cruzi marinkellei TaxID=85056 RepID=K2LTJ8_TRYCR|nr:hypothetical protein MOQ_010275 [Trypanosoma cruzi marinkellei]